MRTNFRVGQFILDRKLGEGGMAEVWLGHNAMLGTPVAVKFLTSPYAGHPELEQRFLREAQRQGALDHPNIVKVYGFEYVEGHSFLIMQYIDGETLDGRMARLGRRPLDPTDILRISGGALTGLDYAHSHNIVHRDIKPSNIMVDRNLYAYLGDFGLVLVRDEQRMTRTGTMMGTPLYMSPEQITRPREVDHRTDIYSFGCVLYEMFAGRSPFEHVGGDSDFNVKLAHTSQPPPPLRVLNPAVAPAVEAVVMRCLEKNPNDRFQTCGQLREALEQVMSNVPSRMGAVAGGGVPRQPTVVESQPFARPMPQPPMARDARFCPLAAIGRRFLARQDAVGLDPGPDGSERDGLSWFHALRHPPIPFMNSGFTLPSWWVLGATLPLLCQLLFQAFAGRLADRLGPRRALLLGMISCSVCVLCAFGAMQMRLTSVLGNAEAAILFSVIVFALGFGEAVV